jgi:hypothetical protein
LADLIDTLRSLEAANVDLYLDQQAIDTTTPAGRMFFHVTGAFAEFERDMIRSRVNAGARQSTRARRAIGAAQDQREGRACNQDASGGWDWHLEDGQGAWRRHERGAADQGDVGVIANPAPPAVCAWHNSTVRNLLARA